jgi:hypothetical protein
MAVTPETISILGTSTTQFESAGAVEWLCSAGQITQEGLYTPPNFTGRYQVTARDSVGALSFGAAQVLGLWNFSTTYALPSERDRRVLVSETPSGVRHTRTKSGTFVKITAGNKVSTRAELDRLLEFWSWHNPTKRFVWVDPLSGRRFAVYADGEVEYSARGAHLWQWQVKVKSADEIDLPGQAFVIYNVLEARHEISFLYSGVAQTRGQYKLHDATEWTTFGDWSSTRTKIFPTLGAGLYNARVITRTGQASAVDTFTVF